MSDWVTDLSHQQPKVYRYDSNQASIFISQRYDNNN